MRLLAVDPGTKALGLAYFNDGKLMRTKTLVANNKDSNKRIFHLVGDLVLENIYADAVSIEDPVIMGAANQMIQKMIGGVMALYYYTPNFYFYRPTQVKKAMGSGSLDKLEVALAAGEFLKTEEEKEIVADAINREAWDETDAVAIGLTYLRASNDS